MEHSEYIANKKLAELCKRNNYARIMFNVQGDIAREAIRQHEARHGSTTAKIVARIAQFFIG